MIGILDALFAVMLGAFLGSFVALASYRLPTMLGLIIDSEKDDGRGNLIAPRSYCPSCGQTLKPQHLVPLLSYLYLRGKCAYCNAPVSARYFVVEMLGAALCVLAISRFGLNISGLLFGLMFMTMLCAAVIDFETGYLPDVLTLPLIILGVGASALGYLPYISIAQSVLGAIVGYGAFRAIGAGFEKFRGIEGLGQGDAKLLAAIGAWLGLNSLPIVVLIASLSGLLYVGTKQLQGKGISAQTEIAFGPALAFGAVVMALLLA